MLVVKLVEGSVAYFNDLRNVFFEKFKVKGLGNNFSFIFPDQALSKDNTIAKNFFDSSNQYLHFRVFRASFNREELLHELGVDKSNHHFVESIGNVHIEV